MTQEPRTTDEVYKSLRDSLTGKIAELTNFTDRSFNYVWTRAFSEEVRQLEVQTLVAELAGWIDYTGGPVTESDLEKLGLADEVDPEEIDAFMEDQYLDEYVKIVGIDRFEGARATGKVTITTQSDKTEIPEGTTVTTAPDDEGNTLDFVTTELASTSDGVTQVSGVPIQAVEVGSEYNLPEDKIVRFESPPIGVRSVTNPSSTTGGEDRESNKELRQRAKTAVQSSSGGGTVDGIKGYIRQHVEGVGQGDIIVDEFIQKKPPYVDVIVDGGLDSEVLDAIRNSRPAGIEHNLVRPQIVQLGFNVDLLGTDIDLSEVVSNIEDFLLNSGIGENYYEDELIRLIMNTDEDIINIDTLKGYIEEVSNEAFVYQSGKSEYRLDFTYEATNGSATVEDSDGETYQEGNDYEIRDQTGDGWPETLVWIGTTPNDGQRFNVDYDVTVPGQTATQDYYFTDEVRDEIFVWTLNYSESEDYEATQSIYKLDHVPFSGSTSITDASGNTYSEGTDYTLIDDTGNGFKQSIDWSDIDLGGAVAEDADVGTTDETTEANNDTADDMTLLPSSPATGDAYYFGHDVQFDDIRIDISTAGAGTWDIVWEYYDGSGWVSLSGVSDGTSDFQNSGVNEVSWNVPTDWSTTSVGGIGGLYWVRARLASFSSISTQPLGRRADQDATPDDNEKFTVTYDRRVFQTKYDIEETEEGQIRDSDGDVYNEDTEYQLVDYTDDGEIDAIEWLTKPSTIADGDEFYFPYITEGDIYFDEREKADPGQVNAEQV